MKLWEQIFKEHELAIHIDLYLDGDALENALKTETPNYIKYKHLATTVDYMVETTLDPFLEKKAYEFMRYYFYDKWDLYYKPYFENNPSHIDIIIECAIDNRINPEYITFLINKKYELDAFKEKDWRL